MSSFSIKYITFILAPAVLAIFGLLIYYKSHFEFAKAIVFDTFKYNFTTTNTQTFLSFHSSCDTPANNMSYRTVGYFPNWVCALFLALFLRNSCLAPLSIR